MRVFQNMKYPMRGDNGIFQSILSENFRKDVGEYMKFKSIFDMLSKSKYLISMLIRTKHGKKFILINLRVC